MQKGVGIFETSNLTRSRFFCVCETNSTRPRFFGGVRTISTRPRVFFGCVDGSEPCGARVTEIPRETTKLPSAVTMVQTDGPRAREEKDGGKFA